MNTRLTEAEFEAMKKRVTYCKVGPDRPPVPSITTVACTRSPYRSKWEAAFANMLGLEKRTGAIKDYAYENLTFKLAHRQYHRNDFLIWHLDGSIEIAQVKGYHKNLRAGIKGLKWAASLNPWFTWTLKRWTGTGWDSHYV